MQARSIPIGPIAQHLALCAATTHLSLVRHFNWVHLCVRAARWPFATRNRSAGACTSLRRLLQTARVRHPVRATRWSPVVADVGTGEATSRTLQLHPSAGCASSFEATLRASSTCA